MNKLEAQIRVYEVYAKHKVVPTTSEVASLASHAILDGIDANSMEAFLFKTLGKRTFIGVDGIERESQEEKAQAFRDYMARNKIAYGSDEGYKAMKKFGIV